MTGYIVNECSTEYEHDFKTLKSALKFAYHELMNFMRKWKRMELETRVIWYANGKNTGSYVGRIRYQGKIITYYRNKNGNAYKLSSDGSLGALTAEQKNIIRKVENNPKNW